MTLTEDNSTEMARADPDGAIEFDGAFFHGNECTFASGNHNPGCVAYCDGMHNNMSDREGCDWRRTYEELGKDETGYYVLPVLCPKCFLNGDVSGVRARRVEQAEENE